jgi:hypothetical protein
MLMLFGARVGALEIRHFTSEMRVQVPAAAPTTSLSLDNYIPAAARHAKLIFFHDEQLLSLHLRFNGARNCSVEKVLTVSTPGLYLPDARASAHSNNN